MKSRLYTHPVYGETFQSLEAGWWHRVFFDAALEKWICQELRQSDRPGQVSWQRLSFVYKGGAKSLAEAVRITLGIDMGNMRKVAGPLPGETFDAWLERTGPQEGDAIVPDDIWRDGPLPPAGEAWWQRKERQRARQLEESTETGLAWVWRQEAKRLRAGRKREQRRKNTFRSRDSGRS